MFKLYCYLFSIKSYVPLNNLHWASRELIYTGFEYKKCDQKQTQFPSLKVEYLENGMH